jgi:alkylation response protein AidB-like acyl-CoA dehydrogenase
MSFSQKNTFAPELLRALEELAGSADGETVWPAKSWDIVRQTGALRWCIPREYGGDGLAGSPLLERYEQLAGACLTSCFILSQRDGACRRIRDSGNGQLCQELLPPLAQSERFATVGLSHLTTSRQHMQPALTAKIQGDAFILNGAMPWVTGAPRADHFVTGAVCDDGRQVLLVLPRHLKGVQVGPPLELMALAGSMTAEVHCENVQVDRRWLLAGPTERVMAQGKGKGGAGGLETSCLALGLVGAALRYLHDQSKARPDLRPGVDRLQKEFSELRSEMYRLAESAAASLPSGASHDPDRWGVDTPRPPDLRPRAADSPDPAIVFRGQANTLVLRATQTALTAAKGVGFLKQHPAQRWARQAMFFLVWSCPRPAAEATLSYLVNQEPFQSTTS